VLLQIIVVMHVNPNITMRVIVVVAAVVAPQQHEALAFWFGVFIAASGRSAGEINRGRRR
jgi:hypothetical protein